MMASYQGFIQQYWEKLGKIIDLMSKLGKIIDIKHNYRSKFILKVKLFRLFYVKHNCLSNILIWIVVSKKKKKKKIPFFTFLIGKIRQ